MAANQHLVDKNGGSKGDNRGCVRRIHAVF